MCVGGGVNHLILRYNLLDQCGCFHDFRGYGLGQEEAVWGV